MGLWELKISVYVFGVIGLICLLFARNIYNLLNILCTHFGFTIGPSQPANLLYVWPLRIIGIISITFAFLFAISGPPMTKIRKDDNRIALLENGKIIKGEVIKKNYQLLASQGWKVIYKFYVEDPRTHKERIYYGAAQGPKKYYGSLSKGDSLTIIYNPVDPKVNCEIRYFLNHPSFRSTFERNNKLKLLLSKFGDKYEIEDYSFKEWYRLQWQK